MVIPKVQTYTGNPYISLKDYFKAKQAGTLTIEFNAKEGIEFISPKGIFYQIPAAAFTNYWGKIVDERIFLEITELSTKRELFFASQSTTSGSNVLDMDVVIEIRLKNYMSTGLRLNKAIQCSLPYAKNQRPTQFQLFEYSKAATKALSADKAFDWKASLNPVFIQKQGSSNRRLSFFIQKLGMIGLAKPLAKSRTSKKRSMFSVVPSQSLSHLDEFEAYLIFEEGKSVLRLARNRNRLVAFHLPSGQKASLIIVGRKGKTFYSYKRLIPKLSSQLVKAELEAISLDQLNLRLHHMSF